MAIELITFENGLVTPQDDALINAIALKQNGMFFGGECMITEDNGIYISSGIGIIYGREFKIIGQDLDVNPDYEDTYGAVIVSIDLEETTAPITLNVYTGTSLYDIVDDPTINETNSGQTEIILAEFDINGTTLDNLVNMPVVKLWETITQADYDALSTAEKNNGTIYFITD